MNKVNSKNKSGYAILELLFYISFFAVLLIVVINSMITMTHAFRETTLQAEFLQSGSILEKISREIRQAYDIDAASTSTDLKLKTKDEMGADKTVEFLLSGSNIQLLENDVVIDNLNAPNIVVTNLTFTQINTVKGKAIRVLLTITSSNDVLSRAVDFYDTIVLRGSY